MKQNDKQFTINNQGFNGKIKILNWKLYKLREDIVKGQKRKCRI